MKKKEHQNSGILGKDTINKLDYSLFKCKKEGLALIMESNQMFILMKNCTKIGLKLNQQMVGLTDIKV
ncbi:hypothetical protein LDK11_11090 [Fusobacterium nucleatum]